MVVPATLFEEFGFNYIGPIDGHDLDSLIPTLENLKRPEGPAVPARGDQEGPGLQARRGRPGAYHGPASSIRRSASSSRRRRPRPTYTQVFGQWLCDMAAHDERLVGITPAMREGSGMVEFEQRFPERYFDVGIAEQHAVTFAAGLACEGLKPVVAIYSTFLQRAYDQLIHDVAMQNLPVVFALDRAGLVGADGADARRRLRHRLPALHPEHERADAGRRERMPADALHRVPAGPPGRGALSARRRRRRRGRSAR